MLTIQQFNNLAIKNFLVIIPAFNEAKVIGKTVAEVMVAVPKGTRVLVVDDGSNDKTRFEVKKARATVVSHPINRGLGGALGTGLYWAKERDIDYVVTFDADGQHDPADILKVLEPIINGQADAVIGTRTKLGWSEIPWDRKIVLTLSNWLTWWLFGIKTTDSTSGLRAFNRKAIEKIQIKTDQMEVSNEFFYEIKRCKLRLKEVPVKVTYTTYSRSKGQKNSNAFNVGVKLLLRLFR